MREHPFQVKEKGYAGFLIPIKINFRNGIHADFTYDLYLSQGSQLDSDLLMIFFRIVKTILN